MPVTGLGASAKGRPRDAVGVPLTQPRAPRRSRLVGLVAGVLLVVTAMACKASPSPDELNRLIDQRLADWGLATMPAAAFASTSPSRSTPSPSSSAASTPKPPPNDAEAVVQSLAFLAKLDDLMKDYKPDLPAVEEPVVEDKSDLLRCVTTDAKRSPDFQKAASKLKKMVDAAKKKADAAREERRREESDFYGARYQLAFHYDDDWATRKGAPLAATYACWWGKGQRWLAPGVVFSNGLVGSDQYICDNSTGRYPPGR